MYPGSCFRTTTGDSRTFTAPIRAVAVDTALFPIQAIFVEGSESVIAA